MRDDFRQIGRITQREASRSAAILALDENDRILMQLRDNFEGVAAGGKWCLFGGSVEEGEDLTAAACREFHEETGITLMRAEVMPLAKFASSSNPGEVIYVFRTTRRIAVSQIKLGEGAGFAFLTQEQTAQKKRKFNKKK
jgi:8-oxo-dGTP diphosphatase